MSGCFFSIDCDIDGTAGGDMVSLDKERNQIRLPGCARLENKSGTGCTVVHKQSGCVRIKAYVHDLLVPKDEM